MQAGRRCWGVPFRLKKRRDDGVVLDFLPLFRCAPEVSGLLGSLEELAFDLPEALLALRLSERH